MSRRDRQKRQNKLGNGWAPLYKATLASDPVKTLPLATYRVYITIVSFCDDYHNGIVPLSRKVLREYGITSVRTITRAVATLLERGLIVRTRAARPRHSALYGVSHRPLNLEAMRKIGAREPGRTRTQPESENSDSRVVRESGHRESELTQNTPDSDPAGVRVTPISQQNSDSRVVTSKNLPGPPGPFWRS